jgi:hypothetical protein
LRQQIKNIYIGFYIKFKQFFNKMKSKTYQIFTRYVSHLGIILILLSGIAGESSIKAQVFASVDLNRNSVYVQQPFHVTITVYTKTWFTQPLEFGNLQIPGAFIVPFDETQPGMFTVNGQQYPGIQFYYIVFPYKPGNYTVPSLEITAQSPPEGSSESRKVVIHTTPKSYVVKDVPAELKKQGTWFVAKNVVLHETWNPHSQTLKVGDVVKRTVTIDAYGTLPQFIPELNKGEALKWASSYSQDPVLTDTRANGDANGRSVQTITYLLEKSGDYTFPAISVAYFNPYTAKTQTASTAPMKIHVNENPNLGILETLRDSLNATVPVQPGKTEKTPFLIFGMPWYVFAGWACIGLLMLFGLIKIVMRLIKYLTKKRREYKMSEKYLFGKFKRSSDNPENFVRTLYKWWDNYPKRSSSSVTETLDKEGEKDTGNKVTDYLEKVMKNENPGKPDNIKQSMTEFRKKKDRRKDDDNDDI